MKVVGLVRLFAQQRGAHLQDLGRRESLRNARVSRLEPIGENAFRAHQHRLDVPQRVVEIETDRADRAVEPWRACYRGNLVNEMLLTMGNKNYSSWSLRPWILLKHLGLASTSACCRSTRRISRATSRG